MAKCRKKHGIVRKTSKGTALKRWSNEKWKDVRNEGCRVREVEARHDAQ